MGHGHCHRCTSTQDGQDLLRVLATEATMRETDITDTLPTSRIERPQGRKIGQSKAKLGHPISQEATAAPDLQQKQEAPNGSSVDW
jgi:hypothetical protein